MIKYGRFNSSALVLILSLLKAKSKEGEYFHRSGMQWGRTFLAAWGNGFLTLKHTQITCGLSEKYGLKTVPWDSEFIGLGQRF